MKEIKKCLSIILVIMMVFSVIPFEGTTVEAASSSLASLKNQYPEGSTWKSSYDGASQCHGWALLVADKAYGYTASSAGRCRNRTRVYNASGLKAGDVIRVYRSTALSDSSAHTIFVTDVNGNTITYADCNWDWNCGIRWDKTTTKASLTNGSFGYGIQYILSAPYELENSMKETTKFSTPLMAYTLATEKTIVYSSIGGSAKVNKIYSTDRCTINAVYENGWCKVTFPLDAGGTETGYVKTAVFFNPDYDTFNATTSKKLTVYRRSDLSETIKNEKNEDEKIAVDAKVQVVGHTSKAVQVLYPRTSGGYGVAWVPISAFTYTIAYNANGGSGTMASTSAKYNGTMTLSTNKFVKTGYTFKGWNVYRSSDKTWYVKGVGWQTSSQISSNGYTKSVYKDGLSCTFDRSWVKGSATNDTLTFYPVWEANVLYVYFNANGGTIDSDTYKLSNEIVCYQSDGSKAYNKWVYNEKKKNGLTNVTTLGLTKAGHTFAGWGSSESGGTIFDQNDTDLVPTSITSDIKTGSCKKILYAIWKPNTYVVKYNANGGTGAPSTQTKTYGTALILSSATPTRNGYTFVGWGTSSDTTTAKYQPGASYTSNKAVTLYAVWEIDNSQTSHAHEWNSDYTVDIEPTCTEEGIKSIHCLTCNESTKVTTIPVTEHTLKEIVIQEASCKTVGQKAVMCSVCGSITDQAEIPKEEHHYVTTVITEATCSQEGVQADVCIECGIQANEKVISKDEHEFEEWTVVTEATVSGDGLESRKCVTCQHEETRPIHYVPVYDENSSMITLGSVQVNGEKEVKMSVNLANNPGFCALNIAFIYDANYFTLKSIQNKVPSMVMTADTAIVWDSAENYLSNGELAELTFEVSEDTPSGKYEIQIIFMGASNSNFEEVTMLGVSGTITVDSVVYGDANGDKQVTTVDLAMIRKYLASKDPITGESSITVQGGADCNGDASVGTVDLAMIRKYLASKDPITGESSIVLGPKS